ncbi:hypothetical protein CLV98_11281 [Dyadobacter jejuensis]|uniref:Uncharacterized protein n=1 Tax=Dyadobacter jejuensis TaxID=1082580 RepID=A0A316ADY0_9BACT|nr:hypothetical protein CLV98_11281 [Dyadobacter jejuensis]
MPEEEKISTSVFVFRVRRKDSTSMYSEMIFREKATEKYI